MSLILDALKRQKPATIAFGRDEDARAEARSDSVLSTLGSRPARRSGLSLRALLIYGAAAMAIGFVGLSLLILFFAPPERPQPGGPPAPAVARPAARQPAADVHPRPQDVPPPASSPSGQAVAGSPAATSTAAPAAAATTRVERPPSTTRTAERVASADSPVAPRDRSPQRPEPAGSRLPERAAGLPQVSSAPGQRSEPPPVTATPSPVPPQPDHFALGLHYQRASDYDNALAQYRALLEQNDASAEGHNNLGLLYLDRNQLDEAVRQLQRAIAIDPAHVTAHNNLGVALLRQNRPDSAAAEFRTALAIQPRNVESLVNLALVQKAAGRLSDARDLLRRAVAIDPRNPGSHYNLAVLADEGGENAMAIEHYRAFLRYGSLNHNDLVPTVRARLAALAG
jgi:Tfp pilus assembly protein PilF